MAWSQIFGHDAPIAALKRAAQRGRLAHGYLFVGLSGIGKRLVARQLAKTLLCENATLEDWDSCDECSACKLVDAGTHPDLFEAQKIEDKLELTIEVVSDLCARLMLKPSRGGRKIAILDDADDFNDTSANAFLKTLEEPPPASLLILIGTNADLQLPTIRSRCQVVSFSALTPQNVEAALRNAEDIEPGSIERLARQCGGRPGFAHEFADPRIWDIRTKLLAAAGFEKTDAIALAGEFWSIVQDAGKDAAAQRRRATIIIRLVIESLRNALSRPADAETAALRSVQRDGLIGQIETCLEADMHVERRVQLQLAIESLVFGLTSPAISAQR